MNPDITPIVENLVRLRSAAEQAEGPLSRELARIADDLERELGPTVRPSDAARLLRLSEPALKRWLDRREIASVLTPNGRREIPLPDLVSLLRDVEIARAGGSARPVSQVIRERHRKAASQIDVDRLLPRSRTHRDAERQALAYHRLIAERLDENLLDRAHRQLERWRSSGRIHNRWATEWERVLSSSVEEIRKVITADTPTARELRQTSPFTGALNEQERRRLSRAVSSRG